MAEEGSDVVPRPSLDSWLRHLHVQQVKEILLLCQQASHCPSLDVAVEHVQQHAPGLAQPEALYPLLSGLNATLAAGPAPGREADHRNRIALLLQLAALSSHEDARTLLQAALASPEGWDAALAAWFAALKGHGRATEWAARRCLSRAWRRWEDRWRARQRLRGQAEAAALASAAVLPPAPLTWRPSHDRLPNGQPPSSGPHRPPPPTTPFTPDATPAESPIPPHRTTPAPQPSLASPVLALHFTACSPTLPSGHPIDAASWSPPSPSHPPFGLGPLSAGPARPHQPEEGRPSPPADPGPGPPGKPLSAALPARRCPVPGAPPPRPTPALLLAPGATAGPQSAAIPPGPVMQETLAEVPRTNSPAAHRPGPNSGGSSPASRISPRSSRDAWADASTAASVSGVLAALRDQRRGRARAESICRWRSAVGMEESVAGPRGGAALGLGMRARVVLRRAWGRWQRYVQGRRRLGGVVLAASALHQRRLTSLCARAFGAWQYYSARHASERWAVAAFARRTHRQRCLAAAFDAWQRAAAARGRRALLAAHFHGWRHVCQLSQLLRAASWRTVRWGWAGWRQYVARRAWEREALLRWATARAAAQLWAAFDFWRRRRWTAVQAEQAAQAYRRSLLGKAFYGWWEARLCQVRVRRAAAWADRALLRRTLRRMRLAVLQASREGVEARLCDHLQGIARRRTLRVAWAAWRRGWQEQGQHRRLQDTIDRRVRRDGWRRWQAALAARRRQRDAALWRFTAAQCERCQQAVLRHWRRRWHQRHLQALLAAHVDAAALRTTAAVFHRWRRKALTAAGLRDRIADLRHALGTLRVYFRTWRHVAADSRRRARLAEHWHTRRLLRRAFIAFRFFHLVVLPAMECRAEQYSRVRVLHAAYCEWFEAFLRRRRTKAVAWRLLQQHGPISAAVRRGLTRPAPGEPEDGPGRR